MAERRKVIKTIESFDDFQGGATFMPNPNSKKGEMIPGWKIWFYNDDGSLWERPMYLTDTSYSNLCLYLASLLPDGVRTSTLKRIADDRLPEVGYTMTINKMSSRKSS